MHTSLGAVLCTFATRVLSTGKTAEMGQKGGNCGYGPLRLVRGGWAAFRPHQVKSAAVSAPASEHRSRGRSPRCHAGRRLRAHSDR
jgi:hypothetical protein